MTVKRGDMILTERQPEMTVTSSAVDPQRTMVNGKEATWTETTLKSWRLHVAPRFAKGETCTDANAFFPRPYVDEYNRGSSKSGFVYTVQPGRRVCFVDLVP